MSLIFDLLNRLNETAFSTAIRESDYWFSAIETVHVLGLALMAGTIAVVDLRLLGVVFRGQRADQLLSRVLPVTWTGFAVMAVSGGLLFVSEAAKLYGNPAFWVKMGLLVIAGLNPLVFHSTVYRSVGDWGAEVAAPRPARLAAASSLLLWTTIIVVGRVIAYFPEGGL